MAVTVEGAAEEEAEGAIEAVVEMACRFLAYKSIVLVVPDFKFIYLFCCSLECLVRNKELQSFCK